MSPKLAKIAVDKAGRLVLPKPLRESLHIAPGDTLEIERDGDRIILSPVRERPGLQKELGTWVFYSGNKLDVSLTDLIDREREERMRELAGE